MVGDLGQVIKDHFDDGSAWGLRLTYVHNRRVDLGLAHSVRLAGEHVQGPFVMLLYDEYYQGPNHAHLPCQLPLDELGYCGLLSGQDAEIIRRNYSVSMGCDRLTHLLEKPRQPQNDLLGTGTLLLSPRVFELLERAFVESVNPPYFIGVLDRVLAAGQTLRLFILAGQYVNVNNVDSLNWAFFLGRTEALPAARLGMVTQSSGLGADLPRLVAEFCVQSRVPRCWWWRPRRRPSGLAGFRWPRPAGCPARRYRTNTEPCWPTAWRRTNASWWPW